MNRIITLEDLLAMSNKHVAEVFHNGHPIEPGSLDDKQYLGVDLSLPPIMNKILWKTFGKTFHRDPETGVLRGWNIRMKQTGWDGPGQPMEKNGVPITFGHYHFVPTDGKKFPKNWQGKQFLDYSVAGNKFWDVARFTYSPLVAVNAGSSELLIGWEVVRLGPFLLGIPDYWALKLDGPIRQIMPPPNQK